MATYTAEDIEVLTGLDPVKKRPGMYTDTTRPNHLAQEVIDNSVDEALAGHANKIEVVLHKDQSVSVSDDGRGMPVDLHPEQKNRVWRLFFQHFMRGVNFLIKTISSPVVYTAWVYRLLMHFHRF